MRVRMGFARLLPLPRLAVMVVAGVRAARYEPSWLLVGVSYSSCALIPMDGWKPVHCRVVDPGFFTACPRVGTRWCPVAAW